MGIVRHEHSLLFCRLVLQTQRRRLRRRRRRLLTSSCKLSVAVFSFRTKRQSRDRVLVLTRLCCCFSTGWHITTRRSSSDARRSVAAIALMMTMMTRRMTSNGARLQSSRDKNLDSAHWMRTLGRKKESLHWETEQSFMDHFEHFSAKVSGVGHQMFTFLPPLIKKRLIKVLTCPNERKSLLNVWVKVPEAHPFATCHSLSLLL